MRTVRALLHTIVAILVLSAIAAPVQAQTRPAPPPVPVDYGIGVGALGGITLSTLRGDVETNAALENRLGYMAGIWFGGNYNGRVGFLGEIDYVIKGTKEKEFGGELELHYLEVPALFRINIGARTREGATFYVVVGPVVGLKIKATLLEPDGDGDLDVSDGYERFDIGVLAGAGVEAKRIGVEVRANWGLRNIEVDPGEGAPAIRNFSIQIVGKFRFN